jgi:hypothetical protein
MTIATEARVAIQRVEDLHRLADQAARNGVRILATIDGAHFATSDTDPTRLHPVTPDGCDCNRFRWFGLCQHHALFLSELGLIADAGHKHIAEMVDDAWRELGDAGGLMPPADPVTIVRVPTDLTYAAD